MKRSLIALTLSAALLCGVPAAAAGSDDSFPAVREYPGFSDIAAGTWYHDYVKLGYELNFLNGKGAGFDPEGEIKVGEMAKLATNIYTALTGETIPSATPKVGESVHWAYSDMAFLRHLGADVPADGERPATRADLVAFLSAVVPAEFLTPINHIERLPDSSDPEVLAFYNAGLLTGMDDYGAFLGSKTLRRCEAAGMAARIARTSLRVSYQPKDWAVMLSAKAQPGDVYFTKTGGGTVTADTYLTAVTGLIAGLEADCAGAGIAFNWNNTVDGVPFLKYVKESALTACGVTAKEGTDLFRAFDVQVFYSKLFELRGFKPL